MNPSPSQYELATLAAAIPIHDSMKDGEHFEGELAYRAHHAFELWKICGQLIASEPAMAAAMEAKTENRLRFYLQFPDGESVPLDDFLRAVRPSESLATSRAKWRKFRLHDLGRDSETTEGLRQAGLILDEEKRKGLRRAGLHLVCDRFLSFVELQTRLAASDRSAKAASARHAPTRNEKAAKSKALEDRKWKRGKSAPPMSKEQVAGETADIIEKVTQRLAENQVKKDLLKKRVAGSRTGKPTLSGTSKQNTIPAKKSGPRPKQRK